MHRELDKSKYKISIHDSNSLCQHVPFLSATRTCDSACALCNPCNQVNQPLTLDLVPLCRLHPKLSSLPVLLTWILNCFSLTLCPNACAVTFFLALHTENLNKLPVCTNYTDIRHNSLFFLLKKQKVMHIFIQKINFIFSKSFSHNFSISSSANSIAKYSNFI